MYPCTFCDEFLGHTFKKLQRHIKFIHSHEPNFSITCNDCGRSFRKFASFKTHIRREQAKKQQAERYAPEEDFDANVEYFDVGSDSEGDSEEEREAGNQVADMTKFIALFILKTKEENRLSQQAIDSILVNTEDIVENSLQCLKQKISFCLANNDIQIADIPGLSDIFEEPSVFSCAKEPLANDYLQVKYFIEHFDFVVSVAISCTIAMHNCPISIYKNKRHHLEALGNKYKVCMSLEMLPLV